MKDIYVSYKQAKSLYMLDFDEDVEMAYYKHSHMEEAELTNRIRAEKISRCYDGTDIYPAPSIDQVQRWLRDRWGIYVEVSFVYKSRFDLYIKSERFNVHKLINMEFKSFENALNTGIDIALSLLEIIILI